MENDRSQVNPLEYFNSGGVVIIKIPEGINVVLQKNGSNLRAAVTTSGQHSPDEFRKLVTNLGGNMAIIRSALDSIGVIQEIEKGSGILIGVGYNVDVEQALKDNFKWEDG